MHAWRTRTSRGRQGLIGLGIVVAVLTAIFIPRDYKVAALLSLPVGAVVGTLYSFVAWELPNGPGEDDVRAFFVFLASVAGLLSVMGWLGAVILRSRNAATTDPASTPG